MTMYGKNAKTALAISAGAVGISGHSGQEARSRKKVMRSRKMPRLIQARMMVAWVTFLQVFTSSMGAVKG